MRLTRDTERLLGPWRSLDMRRLWRVLLHSVLVGVLAGIIACVFFYCLEWTEWLLQGQLANHEPLRPRGELEITPPLGHEQPSRMWLLALLPALGGLACGLLVSKFAPEAAGAGGDAYLEAFHNQRGVIRRRVPLVKSLASIVTIGTGGSAGREGPVMQTCAGVGSLLARGLRLGDQERRILLVAGAAAGMGAIFRTPLGAALYAVEVLYRDDFESDAIVPAIIASVTGYSIFITVFGPGHLFATDPSYPYHPLALPLYGLMAVALALFAAVFVTLRDALRKRVFEKLAGPRWLRPAAGGALLGLLALAVPEALGTGYGLVQGAVLGADWIPPARAGVLLLWGLGAAKMLATSFTIASEGSGGEFGPSLVIGGLVGAGFGMMFHQLAPNLVPQPGAFALVGMGAFFGGVAHVPVSSLIMVCEMAGSYDLLVPLMLAEGITFVLLRWVKLYPKQLNTRIDSPAHRDEATIDILSSLRVRDVYAKDVALHEVTPGTSMHDVLEVLREAPHPALAVRDAQAKLVGLISLDAVQGSILDDEVGELAVAADMMVAPQLVGLDEDLTRALHAFSVSGVGVLPVVDREASPPQVVGVITQLDVTREYDHAVAQRALNRRTTMM
jgi:CIC family chloride channel protein